MSDSDLQYPTLNSRLQRDYQETLVELGNAFAINFDLWECSDEWRCASHHYSADETSKGFLEHIDMNALLDDAVFSQNPIVQPLIGNSSLILLPVSFTQPKSSQSSIVVAAVGVVTEGDINVLKRLALVTLNLLREQQKSQVNQRQMNQYAEQVSYDFEELYWLRNLASHLEYCGVENPVTEVADKVLPSLRELIKSESLLFFPTLHESDNSDLQENSATLVYGNQDLNLNECQKIVTQFQEQARIQPVVHNLLFHNQKIEQSNLTGTFALVPVAKGNFIAGWLLAINKEEVQTPSESSSSYSTSYSECEFGTFEVGLMAASGILIANHARNAQLFADQESLTIGVIRSLINSVDAKDPYTCGHSDRVALMAKRLAKQYGLDEEKCEQIYMTGLLHDVGKIGIPDDVLLKPGRLTDEEFDIIKQHPEIGYNILKHLKPLEYTLPGVLHHHERYDGKGYPHQLAGEDIPLDGRILAVVDAYDAMTSSRPYRKAMPFEKAESILLENAGTQWDAKLIKCFFAALDDIHDICSRTVEETKELFQHNDSNKDSIDSAVSLTHQE